MRKIDYLCIFMIFICSKLFLFLMLYALGGSFFGGGNDSDYYHAYAEGQTEVVTSIWPVMLRWLNETGLYSREAIGHVLKFIGFVAVPCLVGALTYHKASVVRHHVFWCAVLVISAYPTLNFFTLDIYRDVFMVFLWLLGLGIFKVLSSGQNVLTNLPVFMLGLVMAYLLYLFRPYLGVSYFAALVFSVLYSFRKYPFTFSVVALMVGLLVMFVAGALEPLLRYRSLFEQGQPAGTNLGIGFSSLGRFLPDFALTVSYQLFGFRLVNLPTVFVFLTESLPFMAFLLYAVRYRRFSTKFVDYLMVFFVAYSVIWLLGNDNMGTAARLRVFSYIPVFIAACVIYQQKKLAGAAVHH